MKKILIIGYGSIGKKKHTYYAKEIGLQPIVLTKYPDNDDKIKFITDIKEAKNIEYAIIATPTYKHLDDFKNLVKNTNCKNVLIEKPVSANYMQAKEIMFLAQKHDVNVRVAYCLRFVNAISKLKHLINQNYNKIRLVNITAGQYLPDWRLGTDYRNSYSADKTMGGGVHLDLSHELDYAFYIFGYPIEILTTIKNKISSLEINSIDYYQAIYKYKSFIMNIQLDYFRKSKRVIEVIGENENIIYFDFVNSLFRYKNEDIQDDYSFNIPDNYKLQLEDFLSHKEDSKLTTLEESLEIMKYLEV